MSGTEQEQEQDQAQEETIRPLTSEQMQTLIVSMLKAARGKPVHETKLAPPLGWAARVLVESVMLGGVLDGTFELLPGTDSENVALRLAGWPAADRERRPRVTGVSVQYAWPGALGSPLSRTRPQRLSPVPAPAVPATMPVFHQIGPVARKRITPGLLARIEDSRQAAVRLYGGRQERAPLPPWTERVPMGVELRRWRQNSGHTQRQVAERADVSQGLVAQVELDPHDNRWRSTRERMASALKCLDSEAAVSSRVEQSSTLVTD